MNRVWVPAYQRNDGTRVRGYWRRQASGGGDGGARIARRGALLIGVAAFGGFALRNQFSSAAADLPTVRIHVPSGSTRIGRATFTFLRRDLSPRGDEGRKTLPVPLQVINGESEPIVFVFEAQEMQTDTGLIVAAKGQIRLLRGERTNVTLVFSMGQEVVPEKLVLRLGSRRVAIGLRELPAPENSPTPTGAKPATSPGGAAWRTATSVASA